MFSARFYFILFSTLTLLAGRSLFAASCPETDEHTIMMLHFDEGDDVVIHDSSGKLPSVDLLPLADGLAPTWPVKNAKGNGLLTTKESWGGFTSWSQSDISGYALYFDCGYVKVPAFPNLLNVSEGTIELWVYPTAEHNKIGGIISLDNKPAIYAIPGAGSNSLNLVCQWDGLDNPKLNAGIIKANEWSHIAAIWNNKKLSIYVDGQLRAETKYNPTQLTFSDKSYTIGSGMADKVNYFTGMIDEVCISDAAREIKTPSYYKSYKKLSSGLAMSKEQIASWQKAFDWPTVQIKSAKECMEKSPPQAFLNLGDKGPDRSKTVPENWQEVQEGLGNAMDEGIGKNITPGNSVDYANSQSDTNSAVLDMNDSAGFVTFARHYDEIVYKYTKPFVNELNPTLKIFAARDEFEPAVFSIRTLCDLKDVNVTISNLINADDEILGKENIDIRCVRYFRQKAAEGKFAIVPKTLEKRLPMDINDGITQTFWLTIYVPKDAKQGLYCGNITISSKGKSYKEIPVRLRVLPFELSDSEMNFGSFFLGRFEGCPRNQYIYKANFDKVFNFYASHGLNTVFFFEVNPKMSYQQGNVLVDMNELDSVVKNYQKAGLNNAIFLDVRTVAVWCNELGKKIADEVLKNGKEPDSVQMYHGYKSTPEWDVNYTPNIYTKKVYKQVIAGIMNYAGEHNWPEIYFGAEEELKHTVGKYISYENYYKLIREVPGAKLCLVDDSPLAGIDRCQRYDNIDSNNISWRVQHDINPKMIENAKKSGDTFCSYNSGWGRLSFGWYALASEVDGVLQWADQWSDVDPYADLPKLSWFFCYPSPKGPIPTIWSETTREGIDDIRYIKTLQKLITMAKSSNNEEAKQIALKAEKDIQNVLVNIPKTTRLQKSALKDVSKRDWDIIRWNITSDIMELKEVIEN